MKRLSSFLIYLAVVSLSASCVDCTNHDENPDECSTQMVCTEVFVSVNIPIEFEQMSVTDVHYALTSVKSNGKLLQLTSYNKPFDMGPYSALIVNDSNLDDLRRSGTVVLLSFYDKSHKLLAEQEFSIGHDCCHVVKISGPDKIKL
jgi:hypothetical protein